MIYFKKLLLLIIPLILSVSTTVQAQESKDTYIAEEYQNYIYEIADTYNVCPELIMSMVENESSGKADAVNGKCIGLMQVSNKNHKNRMKELGVTDLTDPYSNILVGTDYLMELAEKYGDLYIVLAKYHGEKNIDVNNPSSYVTTIVNRGIELERIHGK